VLLLLLLLLLLLVCWCSGDWVLLPLLYRFRGSNRLESLLLLPAE